MLDLAELTSIQLGNMSFVFNDRASPSLVMRSGVSWR